MSALKPIGHERFSNCQPNLKDVVDFGKEGSQHQLSRGRCALREAWDERLLATHREFWFTKAELDSGRAPSISKRGWTKHKDTLEYLCHWEYDRFNRDGRRGQNVDTVNTTFNPKHACLTAPEQWFSRTHNPCVWVEPDNMMDFFGEDVSYLDSDPEAHYLRKAEEFQSYVLYNSQNGTNFEFYERVKMNSNGDSFDVRSIDNSKYNYVTQVLPPSTERLYQEVDAFEHQGVPMDVNDVSTLLMDRQPSTPHDLMVDYYRAGHHVCSLMGYNDCENYNPKQHKFDGLCRWVETPGAEDPSIPLNYQPQAVAFDVSDADIPIRFDKQDMRSLFPEFKPLHCMALEKPCDVVHGLYGHGDPEWCLKTKECSPLDVESIALMPHHLPYKEVFPDESMDLMKATSYELLDRANVALRQTCEAYQRDRVQFVLSASINPSDPTGWIRRNRASQPTPTDDYCIFIADVAPHGSTMAYLASRMGYFRCCRDIIKDEGRDALEVSTNRPTEDSKETPEHVEVANVSDAIEAKDDFFGAYRKVEPVSSPTTTANTALFSESVVLDHLNQLSMNHRERDLFGKWLTVHEFDKTLEYPEITPAEAKVRVGYSWEWQSATVPDMSSNVSMEASHKRSLLTMKDMILNYTSLRMPSRDIAEDHWTDGRYAEYMKDVFPAMKSALQFKVGHFGFADPIEGDLAATSETHARSSRRTLQEVPSVSNPASHSDVITRYADHPLNELLYNIKLWSDDLAQYPVPAESVSLIPGLPTYEEIERGFIFLVPMFILGLVKIVTSLIAYVFVRRNKDEAKPY